MGAKHSPYRHFNIGLCKDIFEFPQQSQQKFLNNITIEEYCFLSSHFLANMTITSFYSCAFGSWCKHFGSRVVMSGFTFLVIAFGSRGLGPMVKSCPRSRHNTKPVCQLNFLIVFLLLSRSLFISLKISFYANFVKESGGRASVT